ncbi:MAG: hypothetical protein OXN90_08060 [Gemmatimonadota bacterium]|nr:hypothetical protein [Gemmatimonadota bacterium]
MLWAKVKLTKKAAIWAVGLLVGGPASWVVYHEGSLISMRSPMSAEARRIVVDFADCLDSAAETIASPGIGGVSFHGCKLLYLSDDSLRGGLATVTAADSSAAAAMEDLAQGLESRIEDAFEMLPMVGEEPPPDYTRMRLLRAAGRLSTAAEEARRIGESIR